ncbi:MAG: glycosyltransferase family 4 protein [Proteobacteria bacterium]|nr:glycosyltransferase family 4 protein [Pseudomonadota bacterium]
MPNKPRVVLLSTVAAPFQCEVADAMREAGKWDYHLVFAHGPAVNRGPHWAVDRVADQVHLGTGEAQAYEWSRSKLEGLRPDLLLCSTYRGPLAQAAFAYADRHSTPVGLWAEQPDPVSALKEPIKRVMVRRLVSRFSFVIAIGDRAWRLYKASVGVQRAHLVPYGQDLSRHFAVQRELTGRPLRFLFSGQLVSRHNIGMLFDALASVAEQEEKPFSVTVAAAGPEQRRVDAALQRSPRLLANLRYDRSYKTWEDRVRPFVSSDVLLYPSSYSGWGLVVPEAMAAGLLVVTTSGVEAARYFITPGVDGLLVDRTATSVREAIKWCLNNPLTVRRMGLAARSGAERGASKRTASVLGDVLGRYLQPDGEGDRIRRQLRAAPTVEARPEL